MDLDDSGLIWVQREELYERFLGVRSRAQLQRDIKSERLPTKVNPDGVELVGIPADTPPTARAQLVEAKAGIERLERVVAAERAELKRVRRALRAEAARTRELRREVGQLRGRLVDEASYRYHLTLELRMQGLDRDIKVKGGCQGMLANVPGLYLVYSGAPDEVPRDESPEILVRGRGFVRLTGPLISEVRAYVKTYSQVHDPGKFRSDFGIPDAVHAQWIAGHVGYLIPFMILNRVGVRAGEIARATAQLRVKRGRVDREPGLRESYATGDGWGTASPGSVRRVATIWPRVPDEGEAFGEEVAFLIRRWRQLRELVTGQHLGGVSKRNPKEALEFREELLKVELDLIGEHGVCVLGGGSGLRLDDDLWDAGGMRSEVRWREAELARVREARARLDRWIGWRVVGAVARGVKRLFR